MEYKLDMGAWNSIFAVPTALVDKHIKLAGKEQLQIILWLLRHSESSCSPEQLASALGISLDSALDAIEYWVQEGLLSQQEEGALLPAAQKEQPGETVPSPVPPATPAVSPSYTPPASPPIKRVLRTDSSHLVKRMQESADVRYLIQEAENVLGKTISPTLSASLLSLCDDYGLPAEVLLTILSYGKSIGKTATSYIESVAKSWAAEGVNTMEAAEEKLQLLTSKRLAWRKIATIAGISNRAPTKAEEEAAWRWTEEWAFSPEMISAAYERCADSTGKYNTKYMNKILSGWKERGIKTPEQIDAEQAERKEKSTVEKSYSIEEYEENSFFDLPEGL